MQSTIHTTESGTHTHEPAPSKWNPFAKLRVQPHSTSMLDALNQSGKHIYAGTVDPAEVRRRRAANKVARRQRKINRRTK